MTNRPPSPAFWTVGVLATSCAFPILASLVDAEGLTRTIGILDVIVAAIAAAALLWVHHRFHALVTPLHRSRAYELIQSGSLVLLALLAMYFAAGTAMRWEIVVPGLAWRAWLAIYALPSLIASSTVSRHHASGDSPS